MVRHRLAPASHVSPPNLSTPRPPAGSFFILSRGTCGSFAATASPEHEHASSLHRVGRDNPTNDAKLMADTLQGLGFTLVGGGPQLNLDEAAFDKAVQDFGAKLQGVPMSVFSITQGHGVQVRGSNYLVPINANPTREADVDFQMLDVALVLRQMESAGTRLNLVILDVCRNNPFGGRGLRASGGGLAQMQAPEGTPISYATQPGNVAQDGADGDSPYTKALAATMRHAGPRYFSDVQ